MPLHVSRALDGASQISAFVSALHRRTHNLDLVFDDTIGDMIINNLGDHLNAIGAMINRQEIVVDYGRQPQLPSWVTSVVSAPAAETKQFLVNVRALELWQPHHMNEREEVTYNTILKRARQRRHLWYPDLRVAETLLKYQFMIPWRCEGQFFFWGTKVRGVQPHDNRDNPKKPSLYIPYIEWNGYSDKKADHHFELKWGNIEPTLRWGRQGNRIVVMSKESY